MWHDFHFLRPFWLMMIVPLIALTYHLLKQKPALQAWRAICDPTLLNYLLKTSSKRRHLLPLACFTLSCFCIIVALAGPTWLRIPVPVYQAIQSRILLLDLSEDMLKKDFSPDRLTRAKFKIHDILQHRDAGQFGLIVYTSEPFVVSPLTQDGQTIDALLPTLTPAIMPIQGNLLEKALEEARRSMTSSGSTTGEVLVFTAKIPSHKAVETAKALATNGIHVSAVPMLNDPMVLQLFKPLASAGNGTIYPFSDTNQDIEKWLSSRFEALHYQSDTLDHIPLWYDEGHWFILPALIFLLPIFRRGWLERLLG